MQIKHPGCIKNVRPINQKQGHSQTLFDGGAHYFYNTPRYQHADSYVHLLTVIA